MRPLSCVYCTLYNWNPQTQNELIILLEIGDSCPFTREYQPLLSTLQLSTHLPLSLPIEKMLGLGSRYYTHSQTFTLDPSLALMHNVSTDGWMQKVWCKHQMQCCITRTLKNISVSNMIDALVCKNCKWISIYIMMHILHWILTTDKTSSRK